jgi:hypothetical protein
MTLPALRSGRYSMLTRNFVVQWNAGEYRDFVSFLDDLSFEKVVLYILGARFMTKAELLWQYVRGALCLATRCRQMRRVDNLVVFPYGDWGQFTWQIREQWLVPSC